MSMMPNTSVSPAASRNSISPNCTPFSACSRKRIADMKIGTVPIFPARLLHRAVFEPEVAVVLEDGADLAVDDAPLAVLDQRAHVVILERRAVRRLLPRPPRGLGALGRLHQRGAKRLRVLDLALHVPHRPSADQCAAASLLARGARQ